nr:vacuolar protein 8 [Ipomoea batatas]
MSNPHSITETQNFKGKWSVMRIKLSALQTHLAELSSAAANDNPLCGPSSGVVPMLVTLLDSTSSSEIKEKTVTALAKISTVDSSKYCATARTKLGPSGAEEEFHLCYKFVKPAPPNCQEWLFRHHVCSENVIGCLFGKKEVKIAN